MSPNADARSLAGVRVVDLTRHLPGPFATSLLARFGAEVVKVELPYWSDPARSHPPGGALHGLLNRDKRSLCLDFRAPEGREALLRLIRDSRVFVEGFRPGLLDRLGLGFKELKRVRKDLIYCSLTGYGRSGAMSRVAGHDLDYLAWSGVLSQTETLPPLPMADLAGAFTAALSIVAALRSKEAAVLDVSMSAAALACAHLPASEFLATGRAPGPGERWWSGSNPFYALYRTQDGRLMAVAALEKRFALRLLELAGLQPLARLADAPEKHAARLRRALAACFRKKTQAVWTRLLLDKECCVAPVRTVAEALKGAPLRRALRAPRLGADGPAVLASIGISAKAIRRLQEKGILAAGK